MQTGNLLFVDTDGASNTKNAQTDFLGKQRLLEMVRSNPRSPTQLLQTIVDQFNAFTGEVEQFNDITMLAVRKR